MNVYCVELPIPLNFCPATSLFSQLRAPPTHFRSVTSAMINIRNLIADVKTLWHPGAFGDFRKKNA